MSATGRTGGFTLIETLVVVAVTGLIAGLGFPAVQHAIRAQQFRTAEAQLVSALRTARANAVSGGEESRFALAANGRAFVVGSAVAAPLIEGIAVTAVDRASIRFFADGTSNGGRFVLADDRHHADVTVYPSTGLTVVTDRR